MAKVAFLGTGMLGSAMAEGMLRRGDAVTAWNRTASKARALESNGAHVAPTPGEAVAGAERVHMTFSDDSVVDAIVAEFLPKLAAGAVVIDHTTTSPAGTIARYARMQKTGVKFLHAPVFMSPQMARDSVGLLLSSGPHFRHHCRRHRCVRHGEGTRHVARGRAGGVFEVPAWRRDQGARRKNGAG
jgi:3-hydroxyisobutyrate dehydrogenase